MIADEDHQLDTLMEAAIGAVVAAQHVRFQGAQPPGSFEECVSISERLENRLPFPLPPTWEQCKAYLREMLHEALKLLDKEG